VLIVPYSAGLILLVMVGIEVGYQFYSRAEMVAVGFHSHWLNGIDYMGQSYAKAVMKLLFYAVFYKYSNLEIYRFKGPNWRRLF